MRSETEIKDMQELFIATGDDLVAINSAVRDALTWVLGGIPTEDLMEQYYVVGGDYQCVTCPYRGSVDRCADGSDKRPE